MPPDYTPFANLVPRERRGDLLAAVRKARDELGLSNAALGHEIEQVVKAHNAVAGRMPMKLGHPENDPGRRTNNQLSGFVRTSRYIPLYLAWLCWRAPAAAEAFCRKANVEYLPYGEEKERPESVGASNWAKLMETYGCFAHLHVVPASEIAQGLLEFADDEPVADRPMRLGERFVFRFDAPVSGYVVGFQRYLDDWYPLVLGKEQRRVHVEAGLHLLPRGPGGKPAPIKERKNPDRYGFGFLVTEKVELAALFDRVDRRRPLPEELAAVAEGMIRRLPHAARKIFRINVSIGE